ncbi:DUF1826 domain-containing protein [Algiphilus sp.]|uniref:DUF1826 domain-containing protein n=1 Tax=Algiphilus sp. TaxID=1872431 RepID=UPI003BACB590
MQTVSGAHAMTQYAGGPSAAVLADIYQPAVNLAVWEGGLDWQARLGAETLCRARPGFLCNSHGRASAVDADVRRRWPSDPALAPLLQAVTDCARMFEELFEPPAIGLRITALDRAMCPRFHVDRIPVRMIATFCGPGTEWLPNHAVDRDHLGASGAASSPQVQRLRAGDVALMKGENWLGNEGNGLVHRSPAVEGHTARLIATIDWLD